MDGGEVVLHVDGVAVRGEPPEHDRHGYMQRPDNAAVSSDLTDGRVLDQDEFWVDVAGLVHPIGTMTTPHLANVLLFLERTAQQWLIEWYADHEIADDPLPTSLLVIARASRAEAVALVRSLPVVLAIENELAHRLGAPTTAPAPIVWFGARFTSKSASEHAWSAHHDASPGPNTSLFNLAWHMNNRPAPERGVRDRRSDP